MSDLLRQSCTQLREQAGDRATPAVLMELQLAESLLNRAGNTRDSVAQLLYQRVQKLLADAQVKLASSADAAELPHSNRQSPLAALLDELRNQQVKGGAQPIPELDRKIQEQNERLLGDNSVTQREMATQIKPDKGSEPVALRAAHRLKRSQALRAKQQKIQFALENRPENPGPLNPQRLAVMILNEVQDLSPIYLEQLANYVDILSALEQFKINKPEKTSRPARGNKKARPVDSASEE